MTKIAILDDCQNAAMSTADWRRRRRWLVADSGAGAARIDGNGLTSPSARYKIRNKAAFSPTEQLA